MASTGTCVSCMDGDLVAPRLRIFRNHGRYWQNVSFTRCQPYPFVSEERRPRPRQFRTDVNVYHFSTVILDRGHYRDDTARICLNQSTDRTNRQDARFFSEGPKTASCGEHNSNYHKAAGPPHTHQGADTSRLYRTAATYSSWLSATMITL
jgi:hypothetical protein